MSFLRLPIIICFIYTSFGFSQNPEPDKTKQPNIIFILTDDLGYGDLGIFFQNQRKITYGTAKPNMQTPNLDAMAQEGMIFTQHYAAAPVCAPSRASLLSGLSQGHANVRDNQFDKALADNYTLGNVMQKSGYITAAIGKWGLQGDDRWSKNGNTWPAKPTKRGFDYFYGYMRHKDGHEHYPKEKLYRNVGQVWENDLDVTNALDKCYTADLWTAKAKQWITQQTGANDKPFFMYLAYDTPHAVLELPTQAYPKGGGLNGGLQWVGEPGNMINTASGIPDSWIHPDYADATYSPEGKIIPWPETYKRYATAVRRIDSAVGDLIQLLKDLNIDDNTLVIFTSDNGPSRESYLPGNFIENTPDFFESFGPFDGIKRDVLEGGIRMPLIARWPNHIPKNAINDKPSISYDWLPTFTELVGFPAPANSDGTSLVPTLTNEGVQNPSHIYIEYYQNGKTPGYDEFIPEHRGRSRQNMQMIRLDNYVGLRYNITDPKSNFEIFNTPLDTHQAKNLAMDSDMDTLQNLFKEKVLQMRRVNKSAPRPYDSLHVPSIKLLNPKIGLEWLGFSGAYPWLPNLYQLKPETTGITTGLNDFDFSAVPEDYYVLKGFIRIPEDGQYTFNFSASEKALIRLHDAMLVDADFGYQPNAKKSEIMRLQKGFHPIYIYLQNKRRIQNPIQLQWYKSGMNEEPEPVIFYVE
ncbi:sulfatase-like hydrolase/transferase [Gaetbulibacter aestuarii]|uniref:Sulfatase-like hydrolase/transferase n=1 Tax=Gaetbulibacter aestuarii TaxID=1502358 RepID=A0ABW7MW84_9FLAO